MPSDPISVRFALTREEYVHGMQTLMRRAPTFWIGPVFGALILLVGAYVRDTVSIVWGLVVLALAATSWRVVPGLRWKQAPLLAEHQEHRFTDDGVTVRLGGLENRFPWAFYSRVAETPWVYVLMRNPRQGNFIPKRAFASQEDESRFRRLLRDRLGAPLDG